MFICFFPAVSGSSSTIAKCFTFEHTYICFFDYFCNMFIHSSSKGGILRTKTVFKSSRSNLNWTNTVLKCFEAQSHGYKQTLFWI